MDLERVGEGDHDDDTETSDGDKERRVRVVDQDVRGDVRAESEILRRRDDRAHVRHASRKDEDDADCMYTRQSNDLVDHGRRSDRDANDGVHARLSVRPQLVEAGEEVLPAREGEDEDSVQ